MSKLSQTGMKSPSKHQMPSLSKAFVITCVVVYGVSILGPYSWHIYSVEGILYYAFAMFLFFLGLCSGGLTLFKRQKLAYVPFEVNKRQRNLLLICSLISIVCCIYLVVSFLRYYGTSYILFGGSYTEFSFDERGTGGKIATVLLQLGTASFLINSCSAIKGTRNEEFLIACGFWTTGIYYLLQGSRFTVAVGIILFVYVFVRNRRRANNTKGIIGKSTLKLVLIIVAVVIIVYIFLLLMDTRAADYYLATQRYEFMPGDETVKGVYLDLYYATHGAVNSLYHLCDYIGEAPFIFAYYFENFAPEHPYLFTNTLRVLTQFFSLFDISIIPSSTSVIAELGGGSGRYAGMVWPLVIDYGLYFAPVAAYLSGLLFAKIERFSVSKPFCRIILPCCFVAVLFSPVYFFYVGRLDFVFFWVVIIWLLFGLLRTEHVEIKQVD